MVAPHFAGLLCLSLAQGSLLGGLEQHHDDQPKKHPSDSTPPQRNTVRKESSYNGDFGSRGLWLCATNPRILTVVADQVLS